jgi:hypothetical protein
MGVIINPRGTSGSGKTELVRRIMANYGWGSGSRVEPARRQGRERPIAYRLRHPLGGRPLVLLGHYEATSGGCDTIRAKDGGLDEAFRLAGEYAASGHDVLLEGLLLSGEHLRSAALAKVHELYVLRLNTPLDRCIRNVIARQRAGRRNWAFHRENSNDAAGEHRGGLPAASAARQRRAARLRARAPARAGTAQPRKFQGRGVRQSGPYVLTGTCSGSAAMPAEPKVVRSSR